MSLPVHNFEAGADVSQVNKQRHLLLIEDDTDLASVMIESLAGLGLEITHATGCITGLNAVNECRPDILVLDLGLPDGDGSDVVAELRNRGLSNLPLVVYTVRDLTTDSMALLRLGRTHFLTKSQASLSQLRSVVADMVQDANQTGTRGEL